MLTWLIRRLRTLLGLDDLERRLEALHSVVEDSYHRTAVLEHRLQALEPKPERIPERVKPPKVADPHLGAI
jgi:hypothetical protein